MPVALITGASRGLGRALAEELSARGWNLIVDGRDPTALNDAAARWSGAGEVVTIPGDVGDAGHREELAAAVRREGGLDLLVNNASALGPSPLPRLERFPVDELERLFRINGLAPLALMQGVLRELTAVAGTIVNVTSDAAVEAYPGWGGYGASKAALDQLTAVLAVEQPALRVYAFDPGDMRTAMHQLAFPGEDISDRPGPEAVVPALLRLIEARPASGRYRASDLLAVVGSTP
jgi:NAD(P)-dependent dehydrogenase (short-subunit alcohol dehydrogenase family)